MQKTQKGITLVALVITIVILLILAGISISALTNQGLFARAQEAKDVTEQKTAEENAILNDYLAQMNEILGSGETGGAGETVKKIDLETSESAIEWTMDETTGEITGGGKTLHVGDYVNYQATVTPATDAQLETLNTTLNTYSGDTNNAIENETLTWRILDVQDKKIRLISAEPTTKKISLSGANGYNNAVNLIDDTCKTLYNSTYANNVQNLKIKDIEDHMATKPTLDLTTPYSPSTYNYPSILVQEANQSINGTDTGSLGMSEPVSTLIESKNATGIATEAWKLKKTYYSQSMSDTSFTNKVYYTLFINNGTKNYPIYWMSSRCVIATSGPAGFRVRYVCDGGVNATDLYISNGDTNRWSYAFRPVITLNSNVTVRI